MKYRTEQVATMGSATLCYGGREYKHTVNFETDDYAQAIKVAKETTSKMDKDTEVWVLKSTVKFPEPDFEVVEEDISKAKGK